VDVKLTNTDRVVYPDSGITKGEVIAYYRAVADVMVPHLAGRPLTIERFTKGVDKGGFFQKHAQKHYPAEIRRVELGTKTRVAYPICDSADALVYFANQGGFVLHVWPSRADSPDHPDELVFDLDPPEGGLAAVRETAVKLRDLLDELGMRAFVKTTGSKGLHVLVALDGAATFEAAHVFCAGIAALFERRHPGLITTEFYKKDRKGRLFLDTMRTSYGATFVAPYSLRGKPGAPVSAPIEWSEVDHIAPDGIHLRDVAKRLERGDPWREFRAHPASLTAASAALLGLLR
jgi:bifunctional non-homologous end joining protein LigD